MRSFRLLPSLLALGVCCSPLAASAAVDLTPRWIDTFAEGMVMRRLYFADGEKKITLSLNRETQVTQQGNGTIFRFDKLQFVDFLVTRSRHTPSEIFEGRYLEQYRDSAKRLLPLQARGAAIHEEVANPLPINDWVSYRFVISAELPSGKIFQEVTFLNLNENDQIVLVTTAPERDFEEARHRSFQIIRTWQPMLPGDEKPLTGN